MIPYFSIPDLRIPLPFGFIGLDHLTFHAFGLLVAIGVLFGHKQMTAYAKRHEVPIEKLDAMVPPMLISGFIGAHLFVVIFYRPEDFWTDWWKIWDGLSSFGGFLGGLLGLLVYARLNNIKLMPMMDSIAYGFVHAWIFGRMGCTVAHDHPGMLTDFPLAIQFPEWHSYAGQRLDLGMIEMLYTIGLVLVVRLILEPRITKTGQLTIWIGLLYAPIRFFLDFLRATDLANSDARYYGLTPAQYACIGSIALCIWLLKKQKKTHERT